MMVPFGYARVSTEEQTLNLQLDALKAAGCERIATGQVIGTQAELCGRATISRNLFERTRP
ncbi:MAG: recombinase family protein [Dehalococcoidia bacterium]